MPAEKETGPNVDELVANTRGVRCGGLRCWASRADGKLKEYLDRLREMVKNGEDFSMTVAHEQAKRFFNVPVQRTAFSSHVCDRCSCNGGKKKR